MTCRKCFHGYITHAEAIAGIPGKSFSVVWFLKKAMLNATEEEKKVLERAIKDYQREQILPDFKTIRG
jgi:hypothetical protein